MLKKQIAGRFSQSKKLTGILLKSRLKLRRIQPVDIVSDKSNTRETSL